MTANQSIALMRYNARRCAQSRQRVCTCRCGGQYHGKEHPGGWISEQVQVIREEQTRLGQDQLPGMAP